ncbi:hypothetical protein EON78_06860 [bacterium]|nr:MAG: hypothetical protein EON78_06860 [bacterium]
MTIIFIISGFYNIITNLMGDSCTSLDEDTSSSFCIKNFIIAGSIAEKRDDGNFIRLQLVLNILAVFAMIFFLHYIRYKARITHIETDQKTVSPSDYTILLKKVDENSTNQEIKEWIEGFGTEEFPVKVEKVIRAYDIREYISLRVKKTELKEKKEDALDLENTKSLDEKLQKVKEKIKEYKAHGLKYTPEVFIVFTTAERILLFRVFTD